MTVKCPKCGYINTSENASDNECAKCGLIFSKYKAGKTKTDLKPPLQPRAVKQKKSGALLTIILFLIISSGIAGLIIFIPHKESFRSYPTDQSPEQQRAISITPEYSYNSEKRIALVIGNSAYKSGPLRNPVNDSDLMKRSLEKIGFHVSYGENLSRKEMNHKIRAFGENLADSGTGLFYYAGHGMQVKGRNFLLPVNENIKNEEDVEYEGIDVSRILDKMASAGNRINIVILDACRNNPFARNSRSAERGLAYMNAPGGTFIAYATGPGSVASDGRGKNSIYTQTLAHYIQTPQLKIEDVFKKVRVSVRSATNKRQTPWESTSLVGDFYFCTKGDVLPQLVETEKEIAHPPVEITPPTISGASYC